MIDTQTERRADGAMIARIDERTQNMAENMEKSFAAILQWQNKHEEEDDENEGRITNLEKQNSRQAGAMWVITGLAGFLGIDRIVGIFK